MKSPNVLIIFCPSDLAAGSGKHSGFYIKKLKNQTITIFSVSYFNPFHNTFHLTCNYCKMGVSSYYLATICAFFAGALALPAGAGPEPDIILRGNSTLLDLVRRAEAVNFNQDYIAGGANVQYSPNEGAGTYTVNYNTQDDFVVGLGWQPGDSK
jgi:hypothetical protein